MCKHSVVVLLGLRVGCEVKCSVERERERERKKERETVRHRERCQNKVDVLVKSHVSDMLATLGMLNWSF